MSWALARKGVRVLVLDRAHFPREKVCGDFVEPRGLRLFHTMGCLGELEAASPLPITHVNLLLDGRTAYRERIPFYAQQSELPQHGYIIPRDVLDERLLASAAQAGADVRQGCQVTSVTRDRNGMHVHYRDGDGTRTAHAPLVVGADGAHSVVARSFGLLHDDPRYMAVSQRAYVANVDVTRGEAAFVFDRDLFPGYGWMFPMAGGRANVGVGILAETRDRYRISVPKLFNAFLQKLQRMHAGCRAMQLASKPIGGIVKTYGGSGRNIFDGGILIGDAGCFVDPMTGEGITPAAESALLGATVIEAALARGSTDIGFLSAYERGFRAYFDPAMRYLDFVACLMRNRHFREFWLAVVKRGCDLAMRDATFARVGGAAFGGMDVRPLDTITRIWARGAGYVLGESARFTGEALSGRIRLVQGVEATMHWHAGWWASLAEDPAWHARWMTAVTAKWLRLSTTTRMREPRVLGPPQLRVGAMSR
jgi:geranylgeranyl reductase family protein